MRVLRSERHDDNAALGELRRTLAVAGRADLIVAGGAVAALAIGGAPEFDAPLVLSPLLAAVVALIEYWRLGKGLSQAHAAPRGVALQSGSSVWAQVARWGLWAAAVLGAGAILGSWWFTFVVLLLAPLGSFRLASAWHVARRERTLGVRYHHARRGWFEERWELTYSPIRAGARFS